MSATETQAAGPDLAAGIAETLLADGAQLLGHVAENPVLLIRRGDEVFAVSNTCTHYGGPLNEGLVVGEAVHCPWHHACFNLRTGAPSAPALNPIDCWKVEREGGMLRVREKISQPRRQATAAGPASVVIVGAGAAGHAAAEALRQAGYQNPITLFAAETSGPVDRPNLSKDYLAGQAPFEWIPLRAPEYFKEHGITLAAGEAVTEIRPAQREVVLAGGKRVGYGALLLATGATPIRLPIPGADAPHVHTLRSLADSDRIIAAAAKAGRAVVIGASFIGLEAAASLRARGLAVDVVAPEAVPLERVLGAAIGKSVQALHEAHGVVFHLGRKPAAIRESDVLLDDGTVLPCDLVIMGVGVRPNVTLAEGAGLKVENGVVVDRFLQTSAPGIYAAGDIARFPSPIAGETVRIEHWTVAQRQGQCAARNILGTNEAYTDVPFFWSAHYDRTIRYTGVGVGFTEVQVNGKADGEAWTAVYRKGERVVAVATLNRDEVNLQAEEALRRSDQGYLQGLAS